MEQKSAMTNDQSAMSNDQSPMPKALRFVRVDSDIIENLIRKEDAAKDTYSDEQKEGLRKAVDDILKSQITNDQSPINYYVSCEPAAPDALPMFLTQNEFMRRMKEMAAHQQGMNFYGQMPDSYNLVLNTNHPLIQELIAKETSEEVEEKANGEGLEAKDTSDTKETVIKTVYKLEGEDERLKQLIDIALLASGQLKGEALAKFVERSVTLL